MFTVFSSTGHLFRISDFCQITYIWQYVQLLQRIEQPLRIVKSHFINMAFIVMHITKYNRICRTSLLTSSFGFSVSQWPVFFLSL